MRHAYFYNLIQFESFADLIAIRPLKLARDFYSEFTIFSTMNRFTLKILASNEFFYEIQRLKLEGTYRGCKPRRPPHLNRRWGRTILKVRSIVDRMTIFFARLFWIVPPHPSSIGPILNCLAMKIDLQPNKTISIGWNVRQMFCCLTL